MKQKGETEMKLKSAVLALATKGLKTKDIAELLQLNESEVIKNLTK